MKDSYITKSIIKIFLIKDRREYKLALLELKSIKKSYQQGKFMIEALKEVDLVIEKGEFTTIFGSTGSGKTTLLNIIGLLDRPTSGKIFFDGKELIDFSKNKLNQYKRNSIGYIPQNNNLIPSMTVWENIEFAARLIELNPVELKNRVMKVLRNFDLVGLENIRVNKLTDGQKKRAAIANAMVEEPVLILADEPTINLDSRTSDEIMKLMVKMNEELGVTIIYSTYKQRIMDYAFRIIGIEDGLITNNKKEGGPCCRFMD